MLAQFQARYPQSSLISDLLTIYQGKFVVRVSAQVEGVTRATGMAAAETLELAEDRARERAIAVLAVDVVVPPNAQQQENNDQSIHSHAPDIQLSSDAMPQAIQINAAEVSSIPQANYGTATTNLNDSMPVSPASLAESTPDPVIPSFTLNSDTEEQDYPNFPEPLAGTGNVTNIQRFPMVPTPENQEFNVENIETISDIQPVTSGNSPFLNNVTPLIPRSYTPDTIPLDEIAQTNIVAPSEPIDLSDAIAKIDVELKNLRWTKTQERKYLERTYGKESRELLTDEQLFEFLHYLELFGQTNRALEDLEWSNEEGRNYLIQTYNKQSRQHLTNQELMEFLQHLKAERSK